MATFTSPQNKLHKAANLIITGSWMQVKPCQPSWPKSTLSPILSLPRHLHVTVYVPKYFLLYSPCTGLSLSVPFRGTSLKILRETFPALSCIHPERLLPLPVKEASVKTTQCPNLLMWAGSFPIISSPRRNGKGTRMPLLRLEFKKDFLFFLS